jgi:hypothetical protein
MGADPGDGVMGRLLFMEKGEAVVAYQGPACSSALLRRFLPDRSPTPGFGVRTAVISASGQAGFLANTGRWLPVGFNTLGNSVKREGRARCYRIVYAGHSPRRSALWMMSEDERILLQNYFVAPQTKY